MPIYTIDWWSLPGLSHMHSLGLGCAAETGSGEGKLVCRILWKFLTWQWKRNPCKGLCVASITIWSFQAHIVTICNIAPVCVSILDWGNNCLYRGKCYIWQPLGHDSMLHIAYCGAIFHPYKISYGEESQWLGYWLQLQKQSDTTQRSYNYQSNHMTNIFCHFYVPLGKPLLCHQTQSSEFKNQ